MMGITGTAMIANDGYNTENIRVNGYEVVKVKDSFSQRNIQALRDAIEGDEFNDLAQIDTKGDIEDDSVLFVKRNIKKDAKVVIECGCGSGRLLSKGIKATHYCEPSNTMIQSLIDNIQKSIPGFTEGRTISPEDCPEVYQAVTECLPFGDNFADTILFMNGFFQVRSDYESLIEINRVLKKGGHFIFNIYSDDSEDIVCGRVLGLENYVRVVKEFGFEPVEIREDGHLCFKKVMDFDLRLLRKLQLVKNESTGEYKIHNLFEPRDRHYL